MRVCLFLVLLGFALGQTAKGTRRVYFTNGNQNGEVNASFCAPGPDGECQWPQYVESVLLAGGIVGVLMGIAYLLLALIFYTTRPCRLFGGKKPSHGVFLAGDEFDFEAGEGYTTKCLWVMKPLILLGFIVCVVVSAIGLQGNDAFDTAVGEFTTSVIETANSTIDTAQEALNRFDDLLKLAKDANVSFPTVDTTTVQGLIDEAQGLVDQASNFSGTVNSMETTRWRVVVAAYAISIIMYFLLLVASCINGHRIAKFTAIFAWVAVILGWLSWSFSYPISMVLDDFCTATETIALTLNQTFLPAELKSLIECDNDAFSSILQAQEAVYEAQDQLCSVLDRACANADLCQVSNYTGDSCYIFNCANPCNGSVRGGVQTALDGVTIQDLVLGCQTDTGQTNASTCGQIISFDQRCQLSGYDVPPLPCNNSQWPIRNLTWAECMVQKRCYNANPLRIELNSLGSVQVVAFLGEMQLFLDTYLPRLLPLAECEPVIEIWNDSQVFVCQDIKPSVVQMYLGSVLVAVSWMVGLVFAILGTKRFNKKNRRPKRTDVEPTGIFKSLRKASKTIGSKTGMQKARTKMNLGARPTVELKKKGSKGSKGSRSKSSRDDYWEPSLEDGTATDSYQAGRHYNDRSEGSRTPTPGTPSGDPDSYSGSSASTVSSPLTSE